MLARVVDGVILIPKTALKVADTAAGTIIGLGAGTAAGGLAVAGSGVVGTLMGGMKGVSGFYQIGKAVFRVRDLISESRRAPDQIVSTTDIDTKPTEDAKQDIEIKVGPVSESKADPAPEAKDETPSTNTPDEDWVTLDSATIDSDDAPAEFVSDIAMDDWVDIEVKLDSSKQDSARENFFHFLSLSKKDLNAAISWLEKQNQTSTDQKSEASTLSDSEQKPSSSEPYLVVKLLDKAAGGFTGGVVSTVFVGIPTAIFAIAGGGVLGGAKGISGIFGGSNLASGADCKDEKEVKDVKDTKGTTEDENVPTPVLQEVQTLQPQRSLHFRRNVSSGLRITTTSAAEPQEQLTQVNQGLLRVDTLLDSNTEGESPKVTPQLRTSPTVKTLFSPKATTIVNTVGANIAQPEVNLGNVSPR
jgi:hypothetical protein